MNSNLNFLFAVLVGVAVISFALMTRSCGAPALPEYFDRKLSLEDAATRAQSLERPVLLLVSDGSDECLRLQQGPLASSRIKRWISENAVPAFLDVARPRQGEQVDVQVLLTRYQISEFPAILVLHDGRELGRQTGFLSRRKLAEWLEALPAAAEPAADPAQDSG